jgi:hypothetical protein
MPPLSCPQMENQRRLRVLWKYNEPWIYKKKCATRYEIYCDERTENRSKSENPEVDRKLFDGTNTVKPARLLREWKAPEKAERKAHSPDVLPTCALFLSSPSQIITKLLRNIGFSRALSLTFSSSSPFFLSQSDDEGSEKGDGEKFQCRPGGKAMRKFFSSLSSSLHSFRWRHKVCLFHCCAPRVRIIDSWSDFRAGDLSSLHQSALGVLGFRPSCFVIWSEVSQLSEKS